MLATVEEMKPSQFQDYINYLKKEQKRGVLLMMTGIIMQLDQKFPEEFRLAMKRIKIYEVRNKALQKSGDK